MYQGWALGVYSQIVYFCIKHYVSKLKNSMEFCKNMHICFCLAHGEKIRFIDPSRHLENTDIDQVNVLLPPDTRLTFSLDQRRRYQWSQFGLKMKVKARNKLIKGCQIVFFQLFIFSFRTLVPALTNRDKVNNHLPFIKTKDPNGGYPHNSEEN